MFKASIRLTTVALLAVAVLGQTPQKTQKSRDDQQDDVIRITTSLVQTDIIVTDKNDQIIPDLKLEDFELYDNGKKQDLKFMEFVSIDSGRRTEGTLPPGARAATEAEAETTAGVTARNIKRITAFVIDDLTIPIEDVQAVRKLLFDFVDNKMND